MGWEMRNGKRYYYQKERHGNKIVSLYWGSSDTAQLAALVDSEARVQREAEQAAMCAVLDRLKTPQALLDYHTALQNAVRAVLTMAGYHQHKRGEWRLQRMTTGLTATDASKRYRALVVQKKRSPDELAEMRKLVSEHPIVARIYGDLGWLAREGILQELEEAAPGARIAASEYADTLREQLGYKESSTLERLLIDDILFCWVCYFRLGFMSSTSTSMQTHLDVMRAANQARFLKAIETLARVRRLLRLPVVQVNIAEQQINIQQ